MEPDRMVIVMDISRGKRNSTGCAPGMSARLTSLKSVYFTDVYTVLFKLSISLTVTE
jgi:hypothetical protein